MNETILQEPTAALQTERSGFRTSNTELLREYEINIRFLNRGCVVSVGCKQIAFESVENAMNAINAYVSNPWEEQEKWREVLR
jgi:hypothetical protein